MKLILLLLLTINTQAALISGYFDSELNTKFNGYYQGWFGNQWPTNEWLVSHKGYAVLGDGIDFTSKAGDGFSSISSLWDLPPSPSGLYTFSVDADSDVKLQVFSGNGFTLSGDALFVNNGTLTSTGNAQVEHLATKVGTEVEFHWNGIDPLMLSIGLENQGYPFPTVNLKSWGLMIPEPGVFPLVLLALALTTLLRRRGV